jgi:hypothetical protein
MYVLIMIGCLNNPNNTNDKICFIFIIATTTTCKKVHLILHGKHMESMLEWSGVDLVSLSLRKEASVVSNKSSSRIPPQPPKTRPNLAHRCTPFAFI